MDFFSCKIAQQDFPSYTLLLPTVSVGNVPQLAVDLLLASLLKDGPDKSSCQFAGYINSDALMPLAGPDPFTFGGQSLATSCQAFVCESRQLVVIQQRSPCFKELRHDYYRSLVDWIKSKKFSRVIVLSASFLEHLPLNLRSNDLFPIKFITTKTCDDKDIELLEVEQTLSRIEPVDRFSLMPSPEGVIHLPGSGSTKMLMKLLDNESVAAVALVLYCSEGDNRPHATAFADRINSWLKIIDFQNASWTVPFSWRLLFGSQTPENIY